MSELYKKYRPTVLADVLGQEQVTEPLANAIEAGKMKHAVIFSGPSGTGKTTVARICKTLLNCGGADYNEMNCADVRGIDTVRLIASRLNMSCMNGGVRIHLIDEAHQLTTEAQNALLKMLEDTPKHVYFILATTNPAKLIATVKTRCGMYTFKSVDPATLFKLLAAVVKAEGLKPTTELKELLELIAANAEGSPRKALVMLESALDCDSHDEQMASVNLYTSEREGIDLARSLCNAGSTWAATAAIIRAIDPVLRANAEGVRHVVLGYAAAIMLGGGEKASWAAHVAGLFRDNFYDSGRNGLVLAAYRVYSTKK